MKNLGPQYLVWDKSAQVRYLKPGRETLHAEFLVTPEEIEKIKAILASERSTERTYLIQLKTAAGAVCAEVGKTVYIRPKASFSVQSHDVMG